MWEAYKFGLDFDVLGLRLVLLDGSDFFDRPLDAELFVDLNELACFELGESQDVLNVEEEQV